MRQAAGTLLIILCIMLTACEQSRVYDKNHSILGAGWHYDEPFVFEVSIMDTSVTYNMFVTVRHTDEFLFNNLWISLATTLPDGSNTSEKVNVELSAPDGKWLGNCVDGICYNAYLIQKNFTFPLQGNYTFSMEQDMRTDPLTGLLDVGIRIEKFKTR